MILDVGGDRFVANRGSLEKFPSTRLGKIVRAESIREVLMYCEEFVPGNNQLYKSEIKCMKVFKIYSDSYIAGF